MKRKPKPRGKTPGSQEVKDNIKALRLDGLTNKEIGRIVGRATATVSRISKSLGMDIKRARRVIEIKGNKGKCSKCGKWRPIDSFRGGRYRLGKPTSLSYCKYCLNLQVRLNLGNNLQAHLRRNLWGLKNRCVKKEIPFNLTLEYVTDLLLLKQKGKCFYTDLNFDLSRGWKPYCITFDKVIPSLGYIQGNIVICTRKANSCKNDLTLGEISAWMPGFYKRIKECPWLTFVKI